MIKEIYDMDITEAVNGKIAVELFKESLKKPCKCINRAFKLIIMDLQMPVMGGVEASKSILELAEADKRNRIG